MFGKKKEEIKEEIKDVLEQTKLVSLAIVGVGCLTVGYILGSITTGAMCRTMMRVK